MTTQEKDRTFEVTKFAVTLVVAVIPAAITYGALQSRVSQLEKGDAKKDAQIEAIEKHNQLQDLQTADWRARMDSRVQNIENLTQEIHNAVVRP